MNMQLFLLETYLEKSFTPMKNFVKSPSIQKQSYIKEITIL